MNRFATLRDEKWNEAKGIQRTRPLPDPVLGALWDSIILDTDLKEQLLSQAVLNFTLRRKVDRTVLPLHGAICSSVSPEPARPRLLAGLRIERPSLSKTVTSACSRSNRTA